MDTKHGAKKPRIEKPIVEPTIEPEKSKKVEKPKRVEPKKSDRTELDEEETTAFNRRIVEKKWYLRGERDILEVFRKYRERILHRMGLTLQKHQFKMDLVINARMNREDKDGFQETVNQMFYGGARTILRENQFDEA